MANQVKVGWVWEAVEGDFMKFWHIKSISGETVKLDNVAKPHIKTERELGFLQRYGRTRPRTNSDKKLRKDNPLGGR